MKKLMSLLFAGVAIIALSGCSDKVGEPDGSELEPIDTSCMPIEIGQRYGDIAFDRNGDLLIAAGGEGDLWLLDRETCEPSIHTTIGEDGILSVVDDSSRDRIYPGGHDGIYEINPNDGTYSKIVDKPYINSIVIAPEGYGAYGGYLIFASYNNLYAYDPSGVDAPELIFTPGVDKAISDLVFGPDGTLYIASYNENKIVTVASDGTAVTFVDMPSNPDGIEVDNAGSLFVACSGNDKLYSVDITTKTVSELGDVDFGPGYYPAGLAFDGFSTLIMKTGENFGIIEAFELD